MNFSAFPAPIVFGKVIDMACIVQQSSCTRKGACIFYDNDKFRIYHHSLAAVVKFAAFAGYTAALCFARNFKFPSENPPDEKKVKTFDYDDDTATAQEKQVFVDDTEI